MTGFAEVAGTYLVTGGASGIGAAVVRELRHQGAKRISVLDLDERGAETIAADVGGESYALDVSDPGSVESFADELRQNGVHLAGIVNAAGRLGGTTFPSISSDDWHEALTTNVAGAYALTAACLDLLADSAAIVNVTSVEAFHVLRTGDGSSMHYAASKGALQTLTLCLAAELAPRGIRVNAVAPGYVSTPMSKSVFGDAARREAIESRIPLGSRAGCPEEVAKPVCFLLSSGASYMTGATILVDGGLTLGTIKFR